MLKHVTYVIVATDKVSGQGNTGSIIPIDLDYNTITLEEKAISAQSLYLTKVLGTGEENDLQNSIRIDKSGNPTLVLTPYQAPVQEKITFTKSTNDIKIGATYTLRIVFKDIVEAKNQFTHTYYVEARTANVADLFTDMAAEIEKHVKSKRVNVTSTATTLVLEALPINDDNSVNSIDEYSRVEMEASLYYTSNDTPINYNQYRTITGLTQTKVEGTPGKGYWKQVRDAENRNMGYKGIVYTGAYPIMEQERSVIKGQGYDTITIEVDNKYLSNDNQYIKSTPITVLAFIPTDANFLTSDLVKKIKAFITGAAVPVSTGGDDHTA